MKLDANQRDRAYSLRNAIEELSREVLARDGQPADPYYKPADLNPAPDQVTLGGEKSLLLPKGTYYTMVRSAEVQQEAGQILGSQITSTNVHHCPDAWRRRPPLHVEVESAKSTAPDGSTTYRLVYFDPDGERNRKMEADFSPQGEVTSFRDKDFASSWGKAIKRFVLGPKIRQH